MYYVPESYALTHENFSESANLNFKANIKLSDEMRFLNPENDCMYWRTYIPWIQGFAKDAI